jgi:hypothetical protein
LSAVLSCSHGLAKQGDSGHSNDKQGQVVPALNAIVDRLRTEDRCQLIMAPGTIDCSYLYAWLRDWHSASAHATIGTGR